MSKDAFARGWKDEDPEVNMDTINDVWPHADWDKSGYLS
jgi:hypothetical protein